MANDARESANPRHIITVRELLLQLQRLPPDLEVWNEGCDCYGPVKGAEVQGGHGGPCYVLIERNHG